MTNGMGVPLASQSATLNNGAIYVNQNGYDGQAWHDTRGKYVQYVSHY